MENQRNSNVQLKIQNFFQTESKNPKMFEPPDKWDYEPGIKIDRRWRIINKALEIFDRSDVEYYLKYSKKR